MRRIATGIALAALLTTACAGTAPVTGVVGVAAPLAANVSGRLLYVRNGAVEELSSNGVHEVAKPGAAGDFMNPSWSPDGKRIAYAVRQKDFSDLGVMNADGSNQALLTNNQSTVVEDNLWAAGPVWSPDGTELVFTSDRGKQEPNIDLRLWSLNLATRAYRQLSVPQVQAGGDADPQYRPGHPGQLVYTQWGYDNNATTPYAALVLLNITTGERFTLTSPQETDYQAAWSPDGKTLAFIRRGPNADELLAAPVPDTLTNDTTLQVTRLEPGINAQPEWSPDGSSIAYIAENNNQFDLYEIAVGTTPSIAAKGKPQQLTNDGIDATSRASWTR